jgi:3,4-dihydroxyphenylacetate 2,3-dioxygenase
MGQLVFAAKVTRIPRMVLSEGPGPLHGCRDDAIQGLRQIGQRLVASGADTVVILDPHWLSHAAYHVNAWDEFQGVFTSSEFPTQIERDGVRPCRQPGPGPRPGGGGHRAWRGHPGP